MSRREDEHSGIRRDVDAVVRSMRLCNERRFFHQRYWERETQEAEFASRVERIPRIESVAEHSWVVADAVLLLAPQFPEIDALRSCALAVVHDKMEIFTGDINPIGRDGKGSRTHAFNEDARHVKESTELERVQHYIDMLAPSSQDLQRELLTEIIRAETPEAKFVKAVDKLQALTFVLIKKAGEMLDNHIRFSLEYGRRSVELYPAIEPHFLELRGRLIRSVARRRRTEVSTIEALLVHPPALDLKF